MLKNVELYTSNYKVTFVFKLYKQMSLHVVVVQQPRLTTLKITQKINNSTFCEMKLSLIFLSSSVQAFRDRCPRTVSQLGGGTQGQKQRAHFFSSHWQHLQEWAIHFHCCHHFKAKIVASCSCSQC